MIDRLLCLLGLHRWEARSELVETTVFTFNRCARPECPRYAVEFLVDVEPLSITRLRAQGVSCSCRRYAFPSPLCPVHGRSAA